MKKPKHKAVHLPALILAATAVVAVLACAKKEAAPSPKEPDQPVAQVQEISMKEKMNKRFQEFLDWYVPQAKKLYKAESLAAWEAYTEGKEESYKRMEEAALAKKKFHSDPAKFAELKEIRESGALTDPLLIRQLDLIYYSYLENQIPADLMERMVKLSTELEKTFNTFRGEVSGKRYTRNDVMEVLKKSKDVKLRRKVWEAHKEVGSLVAEGIIQLVKLRNEAAALLGFKDYRQMQLILQEYTPETLDAIFKDLEEKTEAPFLKYKEEMDKALAKKFKIKPQDLRPWHYEDPFMQEVPQFTEVDFDKYYEGKDLVSIARTYFESFGFDPDRILERSDLFPKEGKSEHAFCFTIDREEPDIRIMCNIRPTDKWMDTLLHELGHAFYDSFYEPEMPWRLREPAHIFTTEGVAQLFGEMTRNPFWLKEVLGVPEKEIAKIREPILKQKALSRLIFARWSLVMYNFEKALYENPDQDLVSLWWDMVEKYQKVKRPEGRTKPDWATKDHILVAPVYYHNYVLGQMFQCQLQEKMAQMAGESDPLRVTFKGKTDLGNYLIEKVFKPGASLHWEKFVYESTGKPLGVDSYIGSLKWGMH